MKDSKIEWTDHTFNPWIGCEKISPGCANCYAEAMMSKRFGAVAWGRGLPRFRTSRKYWNEPYRWEVEARKSGRNPRVFCASLADVFDESVDPAWRNDLMEVIKETPTLEWLLLIKRARAMRRFFGGLDLLFNLQNVWPGVSVENQHYARERIPDLVEVRANVRFISAEPLLGPLDLTPWLKDIGWVIAGGESGPGARPMKEEWVKDIRDQCHEHKVAFFFKQWGGVNKKKAGRLLEGREYNETPGPFAVFNSTDGTRH